MTAADRPSVTDDARAEAWDEGYAAGIERGQGLERTGHLLTRRHELGPAPVNPYRAAGRAETTTEDAQPLAALVRLHHRLIDQMTEALGLDPDRDDDCVPECEGGPAGSEHLLWHLIQRATARTRPTREQIARALAKGYETGQPEPNLHDYRAADAVRALWADQPTDEGGGGA